MVPAQALRCKSSDLFYQSLCASGLELGYTFGKYQHTKCNCFKKWSRSESCIINIAYLPHAQSEYILIPQQEMLYQKGLSDKKPFDIYHDSNIQEVVRVKPILADFAARVHELLAEWPRHPALMQVRPLHLFVLKNETCSQTCETSSSNLRNQILIFDILSKGTSLKGYVCKMPSLLVMCVSYRRTATCNLFVKFQMMYEKRTDFLVDFPSTYEMKKCLLFEQKQWKF